MAQSSSNTSIWGQAVVGLLFYIIYRAFVAVNSELFLQWLFGGMALLFLGLTLKGLLYALQWSWQLEKMKTPTGLYGSAIRPTADDAIGYGLSSDNFDGMGHLVAAKDGQLLFNRSGMHETRVAPTGSGKSQSGSIPIALSLGANCNMVITAKGLEVWEATSKYRSEVLGQECHLINTFEMDGVEGSSINPLDDIVLLCDAEDPEALELGTKKALTLMPVPKGGGGDNKFFGEFGRSFLAKAMVYVGHVQADTGYLCANLTHLNERLCGSDFEFKLFLNEMEECDAFKGALAQSAVRFKSLFKQSPRTAVSVLSEITNCLEPYNKATLLGKNTTTSDFNLEDILHKPMSLYIAMASDKVASQGAYAALVIDTLLGMHLREKRTKNRVVYCLDEFGNLSQGIIPSIIPALYLLRSKNGQIIIFSQDTGIFARYEEEKNAFVTQAQTYMASSIRSVEDAKTYSERAGQTSVIVESINLPQGQNEVENQYSIGISEKQIPNYRPDEFLQMKDYTGVVFYKQHPPIEVNMVHWNAVQEWHDYAQDNGIPTDDAIVVTYKLNRKS